MPANPEEAYTLQLRGELTLRTAAETHRVLSDACCEAQEILIDLSEADETDLSLVQMILAARLSAQRRGKTIRLSTALPETLSRELSRGGFLTSSDSAFWTARG